MAFLDGDVEQRRRAEVENNCAMLCFVQQMKTVTTMYHLRAIDSVLCIL